MITPPLIATLGYTIAYSLFGGALLGVAMLCVVDKMLRK